MGFFLVFLKYLLFVNALTRVPRNVCCVVFDDENACTYHIYSTLFVSSPHAPNDLFLSTNVFFPSSFWWCFPFVSYQTCCGASKEAAIDLACYVSPLVLIPSFNVCFSGWEMKKEMDTQYTYVNTHTRTRYHTSPHVSNCNLAGG